MPPRRFLLATSARNFERRSTKSFVGIDKGIKRIQSARFRRSVEQDLRKICNELVRLLVHIRPRPFPHMFRTVSVFLNTRKASITIIIIAITACIR